MRTESIIIRPGDQGRNEFMQSELIRELPKGLLKWYDFQKGTKALFICGGVDECDVLSEAMMECGLQTDCISLQEIMASQVSITKQQYGYIVFAGALEKSGDPQKFLKILHELLCTDGVLLFGMDNRLGIRYFCGDRDRFTDRNFDSIENYQRVNPADMDKLEGRAYSRAEAVQMLKEAGFETCRFYSILPNLAMPQLLYAEDYLPEEELDVRVWPEYNYPDTVFLEEEKLYTTLIRNGLFHIMANGYLVECPLNAEFANVKHVTTSLNRGRENAMSTIICRDDTVKKIALYPEGTEKLARMLENDEDLRAHGINVVDSRLENGEYVMPYVKGENITQYFRRLLVEDREKFILELDRFWALILQSSEHVPYEEIDWERYEPGWEKRKSDDPDRKKWERIAFGDRNEAFGPILRHGYIDMVSLNCLRVEKEFVFYDQEFYVENLPARTILWRTIGLIYWGSQQMERLYSRRELQERYDLNEHLGLYMSFSNDFISRLRHDRELAVFHSQRRYDMGVVNSNRQRMNYSENEYHRIFRDIFRNTEGRRLYLFGSGNFTRKFLSQYGRDYVVEGILDNNREKWGEKLEGIPICPPEILNNMQPWEYKIIICIKNYVPVLKQIKEMGVKEYGIYDRSLEYPRKIKTAVISEGKGFPKKYHVGYVAGVFDMFHVGHLNLLRRAKEQCDYLIVGVVSDEAVRKGKKTSAVIPFEERLEIVRSCRYVDEAVEIPTEFGDTDEAYRRYQFDVQFSGSDYENDPVWLAKKAYLNKRGADLVFFPYTQSTSSTKLKELIARKLLR